MNLLQLLSLQNSTNVRVILMRRNAMRTALKVAERWSPNLASRWALSLFMRPMRFERPEVEKHALAQARRYVIREGRRVIPIWTWGEGPKVLLVHGWSGRGSQLHPFLKPLLDAGFSVVTFDAPGHGDARGKSSSLLHFERTIREIDRQVGPFHAVIGHSMGGSASLLATQRGFEVSKLVVIGSPAHMDHGARTFVEEFAIGQNLMARVRARAEKRLAMQWDEVRVSAHKPPKSKLLVVHDRTDREIPFEDAELIASWAGAPLIATSGLGHRRILKDESVVARVLDFVKA